LVILLSLKMMQNPDILAAVAALDNAPFTVGFAAETENLEIRNKILGFEKRIEEMHLEFGRFRHGDRETMPDWQGLEREIFVFSRRKIFDLELSKNLDRVMFKFQNRKKINKEFHSHEPGSAMPIFSLKA